MGHKENAPQWDSQTAIIQDLPTKFYNCKYVNICRSQVVKMFMNVYETVTHD